MLTRFEVTNFKNFEETLVFDLTDTNNYKFNEECIENNVVSKALIYGHNGTGKSNLGYAIFDIVKHITSNNINMKNYTNYLNASAVDNDIASYCYEFKFTNGQIKYTYTKKNISTLVSEKIEINGKLFAEVNRELGSDAIINAVGAESLKKNIDNAQVSIISYINKNAFLDSEDTNNQIFLEFVNFVEHMLFFRSVDDGNSYMGHTIGDGKIDQEIIEQNNVEDFQNFLNDLNIDCKLDILDIGEVKILVSKFPNKVIPFFDIASSGTRSLALFYFWYKKIKKENVSFVFIDEFDAFYHFELAKNIIKILKKLHIQVMVTTHNTSLITNELLRPDCYFLLNENKIKSLANRTSKELREAHNIEKMYKAGSFGK